MPVFAAHLFAGATEMADAGRRLLRAAKGLSSSGAESLSLPIGRPPIGRLRPLVTRPGEIPEEDVRALTEWRNRFNGAFLTEFVANDRRTERWLAETVGPDDSRILFMVEDAGRTVGHMGLACIEWETGSAEADAVVRGASAPAGLMTSALDTMWQWGRAALGLSTLGVRVRSDNSAVAFYEHCGFRAVRRVPLRREELTDWVRWVEDPSLGAGDLSLVYLELEDDGARP